MAFNDDKRSLYRNLDKFRLEINCLVTLMMSSFIFPIFIKIKFRSRKLKKNFIFLSIFIK